jgi:hypothetical protein
MPDRNDFNPQPKTWPACSDCMAPYVLRRAISFQPPVRGTKQKKAKKGEIDFQWIWQRDCKHKNAEAVAQGTLRVKATRVVRRKTR